MKITFANPAVPKSGVLVVGVHAGGALTDMARALDKQLKGTISRAMAATPRFKAKLGDLLPIVGLAQKGPSQIILAGLGEAKSLSTTALQRFGGGITAHLLRSRVGAATIHVEGGFAEGVELADAAADVAFGARLRAYRFDKYRTTATPETAPKLRRLSIVCAGAAAARNRFARRDKVADGVYLTRDLTSEPANVLHPESFARRCRELSALGLEVEVLGEKKLEALGMGALLGVGRGSAYRSQVAVMKWSGAPESKQGPVVFVGKGVTFDTGGISLKSPAGMWDMKWDMGGAGVVCGLMCALAGRKAKVNAIGIVGLVENMPSGTAQRPGDVVTSMSGKTIEVLNTDAEGRLVLADILWYAQDRFKPRVMIDLATLTGAIMVSLGTHTAGLFSNDDDLAAQLTQAGTQTGEPVWRMPMGEAYDREIDSDIADVKNIAGGRFGGAIVAAQFLQRFVNDVTWAHLDIAGMVWSSKDAATVPRGGTGFGVALLDRFVADRFES